MSPAPLLLRVLLCISLILNGSSYAMASARMQLMHVGQVVGVPQQTAVEPCGEHGTMVASAETPASNGGAHSTTTQKQQPDCCSSDGCRCACMQHVQAAIDVYRPGESVISHPASTGTLMVGHTAPTLPDMIRPPIG